MLTREKIQGCYWAFALGDTMGMLIEFTHIDVIRQKYGENGIQEPKNWAIWTDDTEMTFATTRTLLKLGGASQIADLDDDTIGIAFADEFIKWFDNMGYAPGITCKTEVFKLRGRGAQKWRDVGKNDSKGCGSAMRASPLGVWFANAIESEKYVFNGKYHKLLAKVSQIQSEITHGHKAATAAALASAYAVVLAINNVPIEDLIEPIDSYCSPIHPDFRQAMNRLKMALKFREKGQFKTDLEAIEHIGQGWVGEEAFAMALYAAIRSPKDLKICLRIAVNHSGDSDSVGCIAGSIVGAYHGIKIVPQDWIPRLAEKTRMESLLHDVELFLLRENKMLE